MSDQPEGKEYEMKEVQGTVCDHEMICIGEDENRVVMKCTKCPHGYAAEKL